MPPSDVMADPARGSQPVKVGSVQSLNSGKPPGHTKANNVPIGRRVYSDGRGKAFRQSWLSWLVSVTTLTVYVAWIPMIFLLIIISFWKPAICIILLGLYSTLFLPATLHSQSFLDGYILKSWREYFNFSYYIEDKFDPERRYILAEFPHGAFPMGPIIAAGAVSECLPSARIYGLGASVLFWIPGYYHLMSWIGVRPATKKNFLRLLDKGWVAVIVGGIAEMFMMSNDQEHIFLRKRKGIVRIAVQTGTDIIPIYHFGNTKVLSFGPAWLKNLSRRMRASIGLMYGVWGLPIPRRHEIMMVCGKPVSPGPAMPPDHPEFASAVDQVHGELVKAMSDIYHQRAREFGWADRPLVID